MLCVCDQTRWKNCKDRKGNKLSDKRSEAYGTDKVNNEKVNNEKVNNEKVNTNKVTNKVTKEKKNNSRFVFYQKKNLGMEKIIKKLKNNSSQNMEQINQYYWLTCNHWNSWKIKSKSVCDLLWMVEDTNIVLLLKNDLTQNKQLYVLSYKNSKTCKTIEKNLQAFKSRGKKNIVLGKFYQVLNNKLLNAVVEINDDVFTYVLWQSAKSSLGCLNILLDN